MVIGVRYLLKLELLWWRRRMLGLFDPMKDKELNISYSNRYYWILGSI